MRRHLSVSFALLLLTSCFDIKRIPGGPPRGYETDSFSCADNRDNDEDGLVDCQDPDCIERNFCGEIIPLLPPQGREDSVRTCTDRIDNDLDGQFDCGDRSCQGISELCCVTEFSDISCSNGVDDDGNGFADCRDSTCRNNPFVTVCDSENDCTNGLDDDGDRAADCDDSDCSQHRDCGGPGDPIEGDENTPERCMDNFDNDDNGFVDCGDFSCCGNRECTAPITPEVGAYCLETQENTVAKCTDGIDNDGNGFADCREFSCCPRNRPCIDAQINEYCESLPTEDTFEACTNGIDDDDNGYTDCEDNSCSRDASDFELRTRCEATYDSCKDGIDNEGDGFIDCADFSCRDFVEMRMTPNGPRELNPCRESIHAPDQNISDEQRRRNIAETSEACRDGFDGDSDGFIDCDDWDCQWNPLLNPGATGGTAPGLCQGGLFDPSLGGGAGAWRAPKDGESSLVTPVPLLCR